MESITEKEGTLKFARCYAEIPKDCFLIREIEGVPRRSWFQNSTAVVITSEYSHLSEVACKYTPMCEHEFFHTNRKYGSRLEQKCIHCGKIINN